MTKNKFIDLFDQHWKGLMHYEDLMESDKIRIKKEYTAQEFYKALKEAYNLGIETSANYLDRHLPYEEDINEITGDDILNLQIE